MKELEDARKELSWTEEDAEWQDKMLELQRDLQRKDILYRTELEQLLRRQQGLDRHIHILTNQLQQIPQSSYGLFNRASSSAFDFDNSPQGQIKRRSRNSNSLSNVTIPSPPAQLYPMAMEPPGSAAGLGAHSRTSLPPGFVGGPFMGLSSAEEPGSDAAGLRGLTAGAPLSPSAASRLPSNIFSDD